ncbi:ABC transporter permease [Actinophytocola oryzae]|uniref:NitT/TauT family transport system permease protein n=1 Tax=Actinophytocola oryzae TaxID=502181 RepID=A0A4R7V1Z2_9PSEU|nr:ABC transporter permease subunit [Actinophytocola oryzae]TDV41855.1 NitT/TauT family transport system permease protein [Actinophytocola oryzae]
MSRLVRNIVGTVGVLAVCELVGRSGLVNPEFLPPPTIIGARLTELLNDRGFSLDVVQSVLSWAMALAIAVALAVPVGIIFGSMPLVRSAFSVVVEFLRPIPSVALIPLAIIAIQTNPEMKISLAVFGAFWPILFNTMHAMSDIEPVQINTARAFNLSRFRTLLSVKLPSITPFVFTGVRISASVALILIISTEILAGGGNDSDELWERGGLGTYIETVAAGGARVDLAIAGTFVAGVIGVVINTIFSQIQRRWINWSDGDRNR